MSNGKFTIGENITKFRKLAGISQDVLSKKADLAFHTIAKIEAGSTPNPTIDTVKKIVKALEVSVDELLKKSKACLPVADRRRWACPSEAHKSAGGMI